LKLPLVHRSSAWRAYVVVGMTLLAPALGGSTGLWAESLLALLVGALLIVSPPRRSLGLLPNICFCALFLIALSGFLPARWFGEDEIRSAFTSFGISLPGTRSPQPWITLESASLLLLGLAWTYFLFACEWPDRYRKRIWLFYAGGILLLASVLIVAFVSKQRIPFWPEVREFGFFPNRNQTGNVLGLGGVMIYALGLQSLQENRRYWWCWPVSLSIVCWALILNYSRAGIILFFFAAVAVHIYWWSTTKERSQPLIAFGGLAFLIALFIIDGGATLVRFGKETAGFFSSGRLTIYRDAFALLNKAPLLGLGLGNFPPIFSVHRQYSVADNDVIHPESDWLWVALELGWVAPVLLLILFAWWINRCRPFAPGSFRLMRASAMICGCAFAVHGIFDVSGHRIGSLWPALFLASIAIYPACRFRSSPAIPWIFRIVGVFLTCAGVWWLMSIFSTKTFATTAALNRLQIRIEEAARTDDYSAVLTLTSEALRIAPLDWSLYYKRGAAEAALFNSLTATERDFAAARYLLPYWPELLFNEGAAWFAVGATDRAFDVWEEALQHLPQKAPDLYRRMFNLIKSDAVAIDRWRELAHADKQLLFIFLESAQPVEFEIELDRLLAGDQQLQSLTPNELSMLFSIWYEKGDKLRLAQVLRENPDWQKIGWKQLARVCADYQDYRPAYETVLKFDPPPVLPATNSDEPVEKLAARFQVNQTDVGNGLALYRAQIKQGRNDAALVTLQKLSAVEGSPKYLFYLEAQLWAESGQWKNAWETVAKFEFGNR
jgi:tetratricopeptide (TPR) repeat protein